MLLDSYLSRLVIPSDSKLHVYTWYSYLLPPDGTPSYKSLHQRTNWALFRQPPLHWVWLAQDTSLMVNMVINQYEARHTLDLPAVTKWTSKRNLRYQFSQPMLGVVLAWSFRCSLSVCLRVTAPEISSILAQSIRGSLLAAPKVLESWFTQQQTGRIVTSLDWFNWYSVI